MQGIDESENISTSSTSRRDPSPFIQHVEMTESGHLDSIEMEEYRKKKKKEKKNLEKRLQKEALFDYGAN